MGKTRRTVTFEDGEGRPRVMQRPEVDSRWRADRAERLKRASIDAKRIERADAHTARHDGAELYDLGAHVRPVVIVADVFAIDAPCPECGWPERTFNVGTRLFGCARPTCTYTSDERNA